MDTGANVKHKTAPQSSLSRWLKVAVMASLSAMLMITVQIPIIPAAPFLTYDLSDLPALLVGFALGPWPGILTILLKNFLFFIYRANPVELVGVPMNSIAGILLVWTSSWFYWRNKTLKTAKISLILAALTMTVLMIPVNLIVYPQLTLLFSNEYLPSSWTYILYVATPFNFVKSVLTCTLGYMLYKRLSGLLK